MAFVDYRVIKLNFNSQLSVGLMRHTLVKGFKIIESEVPGGKW